MAWHEDDDDAPIIAGRLGGGGRKVNVSVVLTDEQAAAVEGWRVANRIQSQGDAVRELVRIGLLSEIGRIYRRIAGGREPEEEPSGGYS